MDGSWFSQALARVGASQADLARHLRLAPSAVSRMLKGDRQMKPLEVVHLAAFLRVPEDEVLRHAVDTTAGPPAGESPSDPAAASSNRKTGSPAWDNPALRESISLARPSGGLLFNLPGW